MVAEHGDDLFGLALPQQPVIDENACQLVADRLVDQHGGDRGIDTARQPADHLLVAHLFADCGDGLFAIGAHRPVAGKARDAHEVFVKTRAVRGVMHLGVELHGIEMPFHIRRDREWRIGRCAVNRKTGGDGGHMVAMAHPDLFTLGQKPAVQQVKLFHRRHIGAAEFGGAMPAFDLAAQHMHHDLLAIADAQNRHADRTPIAAASAHRRRKPTRARPKRSPALGANSVRNASVTLLNG
jgi:hypothetical protein